VNLLELDRAAAPRDIISMMATRGKRLRQQERLDQDLKSVADESGCTRVPAQAQAFPSSRVTPRRGRG
jgi:hypothetical protein